MTATIPEILDPEKDARLVEGLAVSLRVFIQRLIGHIDAAELPGLGLQGQAQASLRDVSALPDYTLARFYQMLCQLELKDDEPKEETGMVLRPRRKLGELWWRAGTRRDRAEDVIIIERRRYVHSHETIVPHVEAAIIGGFSAHLPLSKMEVDQVPLEQRTYYTMWLESHSEVGKFTSGYSTSATDEAFDKGDYWFQDRDAAIAAAQRMAEAENKARK
jgi:hypothetical protein